MKSFILGLTLLTTTLTYASDHHESTLEFTQNSKELFELGEIQDDLVENVLSYKWLGGSIEIIAPYQKSVINETLWCFKLQELSTRDSFLIGLHSLARPKLHYCETVLDLE